ncbi:MAG: PP2C family serine/threonine-protein phosphatase [Thermodesulfobacteriota bacterium]
MKWKVIQASVIGASHSIRGELCQDDCFAAAFLSPSGDECFVALVSDGAGSTIRGGKGAMIACDVGFRVIWEWISQVDCLSSVSAKVVAEWVDTIRYHLWLASRAEGLLLRDYACTLLGAVVADNNAAFFQVGDGAIVIDEGDGFQPVFWPDSGEYANMTYFVTDEDALSHLHSEVSLKAPSEIAVFSDGIQRLALVYQTKEVHRAFFEPMFARLRKAVNDDECDLLSGQLAGFLGSSAVNERTDDDKTLVLATCRLLND